MFSVSRPTVVYDGAVTSADLDEWGHEFDAVMGRMRSLFYRTESKKHAEQYVRGLLSPLARKNGWTISEYAGEPEPKALQRLLYLSPWDVDALLALNHEYALAVRGSLDHAGWGGIQGLADRASRMASMGRRPWLRALTR